MTRLLMTSILAIGLSVPGLTADAANLRHKRPDSVQGGPTVQHPAGLPPVDRRQQVPASGDTDDGGIFGHPVTHG
jgi:hypothetical protein